MRWPLIFWLIGISWQQPFRAYDNTTLTSDESQNETDSTYLYQVQLELKSRKIEEPLREIELRLEKLVEMSATLATYKHRKQVPPVELPKSSTTYKVQITKKRSTSDGTYIQFMSFADDQPILGEVVADDMLLLSLSQISAIIRYPLGRIASDRDIQNESASKWWLIIAILGSGAIIFLIGWFLLFLFYNTCGYMTDRNVQITKQGMYAKRGRISISRPGAVEQSSKRLPSIVSTPDDDISNVLKPDEITGRLEETIRKINEVGMENKDVAPFHAQIADTEEGENKGEDGDVVNWKSENTRMKRHPIDTFTTAEPSEIGSECEAGYSSPPMTTLVLPKKGKIRSKEPDINSDPDSDYGSTSSEESGRSEENVKKVNRPKTAKTKRTSLFDATSSQKPIPKAWSIYRAGDAVAEFYNNKNVFQYPHPGSPSDDGVVEITSSRRL